MAISLANLKSTKTNRPPIVVLYGVDGVGKTSLAAEFPDPIYIQTPGERPPSDVDLPSFGVIESFNDMLDAIASLLTEDHGYRTFIIDSLDGLEPFVQRATAQRIGADSIDSNEKGSPASYGRGYSEADTEWNEYLSGLEELTRQGIAVVQLAHPDITRFDSPISDPYSRYSLKLHKRANALVREKSDIVAFMNYRVTLKSVEAGFNKKVTHGESGGDRQVHLEERAGYVAKNRYNAPATLPYKKGQGYSELSKYFPAPTGIVAHDADARADAA
jgi:hypothetical protein